MSAHTATHQSPEPDLRKELLLASALVHTQPPSERIPTNCARVLRFALKAAGLWDAGTEERSASAFHGDAVDPVIVAWYATLIELTRVAAEERLLQGAGNLALPAGAYYTGCWLTPKGIAEAERVLALHPEWDKHLAGPRRLPRILRADVERVIGRDYSLAVAQKILAMIEAWGRDLEPADRERAQLAALRLAAGDVDELARLIAHADCRELLARAESPEAYARASLDRWPARERQRVFDADRRQYIEWLER